MYDKVDLKKMTDKIVSKCWNKNAEKWAKQADQGKNVYRDHFDTPAFFEFIGDIKNKTVLDAGCGEGSNTRLLAKSGATVFGVDISSKMLEVAINKEAKKPLGITYECISCTNLHKLTDASFDVVIAFMSLMDFADYKNALKEFNRILKASGDLFFNISHPCFITRGYDWSKENKNEDNPQITVSNYFDTKPFIKYLKYSDTTSKVDNLFAIPTSPRTLSCYINGLIETNFSTEKIKEPMPSNEACEKFPYLKKWQSVATPYLYVHGKKRVDQSIPPQQPTSCS